MPDLPVITEAILRRHASEASFARGQAYFQERQVRRVQVRGSVIEGYVAGSGARPYRVRVHFEGTALGAAQCTCPYDWGGWCKHIVAVLLACVAAPHRVTAHVPLEKMLAEQDRTALEAILLELAERSPRVARLIERRCAGTPPPRRYRLR